MRCWRTRVGSVLSHFIGNVARFAGRWGEARAQPWNPVRGWHPLSTVGILGQIVTFVGAGEGRSGVGTLASPWFHRWGAGGKLCPRQKLCSTLVNPSMKVNGETQALLAMGKRQTIGQLCSDSAESLGRKSTIGLLENRLEPQTANTQESFIASIFAIDLLSMPVMNTTAS